MKRRKKVEEEKETLAQDIIPLATIEGSFYRRTDGYSFLLVYVEGTNDSLYTYEQKLEESEANRYALTSINHPCSILKLCKATDSNKQLVHIDKEIALLKKEIREAGREITKNHPKSIRLHYLETYMRPRAEQEATAGDRVIHPTYFVFEFSPKIPDEIASRDVRIFVNRILETDRHAHICDFNEIIEVFQLFFTPRSVHPESIEGNGVVESVRSIK